MKLRGFTIYKRLNIRLGFWWLLSIVFAYIVHKYAQSRGLPLIALAAKAYLVISLGLIALLFLIILLAIILLLFAFGKTGARKTRKEKEEGVIDVNYKVK